MEWNECCSAVRIFRSLGSRASLSTLTLTHTHARALALTLVLSRSQHFHVLRLSGVLPWVSHLQASNRVQKLSSNSPRCRLPLHHC
jgi:hypothetical protein